MWARQLQQGQSLIEIIFAISIFVIGVVTIGYVTIDAFSAVGRVADSTQARLLASEGIEALVAITDSGFENIPAGTHGLSLSEGYWTLAGASDETGKFTRTITIDAIDEDVMEVTSNVTWEVFGGRERNVAYTSVLSNWKQTKGQAGDLTVSTQNVSRISFDREIIGLFLKNDGTEDITVTELSLHWDTTALLTQISIEGADVFTASTSQPVASGESIDIVDYTLLASPDFHYVNSILFDASVAPSNFVMVLTLADGSTRSVYISP